MRRIIRWIGIGICAMVASTAAVVVAPVPASAHTTDPWSGTHTVCRANWCINTGNLVRLWQSVLWADGYSSTTVAIDGQFGTATHNRTVGWQRDRRLDGDGEAGPKTWGRASSGGLIYDVSIPGPNGYHRYFYQGIRSFEVRQQISDGSWRFRDPRDGQLRDTSHGA